MAQCDRMEAIGPHRLSGAGRHSTQLTSLAIVKFDIIAKIRHYSLALIIPILRAYCYFAVLKLTHIKSIPFCRTILINIINNLELLINLLNDQSVNSSRILLSPKCIDACTHVYCLCIAILCCIVWFFQL